MIQWKHSKPEIPERNTLGKHTELSMSLTCRSCIWCWSPAGTSLQPPWTPGPGGRALYPTAASPGSRGRRRLVRRRTRHHRLRRSSNSIARGRMPPSPIAETDAYDWSSDSSCFTQRHLILSGLGRGQTVSFSGWKGGASSRFGGWNLDISFCNRVFESYKWMIKYFIILKIHVPDIAIEIKSRALENKSTLYCESCE